jgi:hypothetical protein
MEPDGPEERTAAAQEQSWADDAHEAALEDHAESQLMDIGEARMLSWAIDRVLG